MSLSIRYGPYTCQLSEPPDDETTERLSQALEFEPKDKAFARRMGRTPAGAKTTKSLYHRGGRVFFTGVLPRVQALLPDAPVVGVPEREPAGPWKLAVENFTPYDYQLASHEALVASGQGVVILPTGTGKTPTAAMVASSFPGQRILITTPNKRLLHQNRQEFAAFLGMPVGILGDRKRDLGPDVVVANIQAIAAAIEQGDAEVLAWLATVNVWVCDECHGAAAESYRVLAKALKTCLRRYGVTATWMREDGCELVLEGILGRPLFEYTYAEAFAGGYITELRTIIRTVPGLPHSRWRTEDPATGKPKDKKPLYGDYLTALTEDEAFNQAIVADVREAVRLGLTPALVMVERIEHGKTLAAMLGCPFVDGEKSTKAVDAELERFLGGAYPVLVASSILNVGVNLKPLVIGFNAASGDSRIAALQKPGRLVRLFDGKTLAFYVDYLIDDSWYFREHGASRRFQYLLNFPGRVLECNAEKPFAEMIARARTKAVAA